MNYTDLMYLHLATVVPCFVLGTMLLLIRKGTPLHKGLGKPYMILMLFTATVTLFMQAQVGPRLFNHFGWIHLFSLLTMYSVPTAYIAIRSGDVKRHRRSMITLYFGAIIIAGGFTLVPGRYLHDVLF
jgi:uncharacterized membrane protein